MRIQYHNGEVSLEGLVAYMNLTGQGSPLYKEFIAIKEASRQAREKGISPTDDDLQKCADNLRTALGLHSAEDTLNYLARSGMTVEDFEDYCESVLLAESFKDILADNGQAEAYFVNNRNQFELARISVAFIKDENLANEIKLQVTEDGEDFHALARKHSADAETRYAGGYLGLVPRSGLREDFAARVFNASPDDLLGPFFNDGLYQLILVHDVIKPELDDQMKGVVRDKIFMEWGARFVREGVVFKSE